MTKKSKIARQAHNLTSPLSARRRGRPDRKTGNPQDMRERYGRHWTQWIKPKGVALLSETLGRAHFVLKNHGPDDVVLVAQRGDLMDVSAGDVRITYAHEIVRVENRTDNPVFIEFDFLPLPFKN